MDLHKSSQALDAWIEKESFRGWDPHDALNSRLLKSLTFKNRKIGQLWVQLLKRSPINFRPLLGIEKDYNPKGMGLFLGTYLRKFSNSHSDVYLKQAQFFLNWLAQNQSLGHSGACWGYNFDWPNRSFFARAGVPTIVNTAFIGLALLDAYKIMKDQTCLDLALSSCEFVLHDLNRLTIEEVGTCLSYTPLDHRFVHNANILGAWLLAEVYALTGEKDLLNMSISCSKFTLHSQAGEGSWPYGISLNEQWIDSFHTGYVLVGLNRISRLLDLPEIGIGVKLGYRYWQKNLFLENGLPKYFSNRVYPIDIHVISQAILTYLEFSSEDVSSKEKAINLAKWGIEHFQHPDGFFYYQKNPAYTIRIPYMRWAQAWMQRALTELLSITS
jgi:hypothetical protein